MFQVCDREPHRRPRRVAELGRTKPTVRLSTFAIGFPLSPSIYRSRMAGRPRRPSLDVSTVTRRSLASVDARAAARADQIGDHFSAARCWPLALCVVTVRPEIGMDMTGGATAMLSCGDGHYIGWHAWSSPFSSGCSYPLDRRYLCPLTRHNSSWWRYSLVRRSKIQASSSKFATVGLPLY